MPESVVHFQIRMPPHLHEHLSDMARDRKCSLNALIVAILQDAAKIALVMRDGHVFKQQS